MTQRAQRSLDAAKKAVPEGTFAVGIGLAVTGITTYAFFVACARGLSAEGLRRRHRRLWPLVFVAWPGLLPPLEQEVGRAGAPSVTEHRGGPVVRRPRSPRLWGTGGPLLLGDLQRCAAREPVQGRPAASGLLRDRAHHHARSALARNAVRERPLRSYGVILGAEGCIRLLPRPSCGSPASPTRSRTACASPSRPCSRARCRSGASTVSSSQARNRRGRSSHEPRIPAERVRPRRASYARSAIATVLATSAACGGRGVRLRVLPRTRSNHPVPGCAGGVAPEARASRGRGRARGLPQRPAQAGAHRHRCRRDRRGRRARARSLGRAALLRQGHQRRRTRDAGGRERSFHPGSRSPSTDARWGTPRPRCKGDRHCGRRSLWGDVRRHRQAFPPRSSPSSSPAPVRRYGGLLVVRCAGVPDQSVEFLEASSTSR